MSVSPPLPLKAKYFRLPSEPHFVPACALSHFTQIFSSSSDTDTKQARARSSRSRWDALTSVPTPSFTAVSLKILLLIPPSTTYVSL